MKNLSLKFIKSIRKEKNKIFNIFFILLLSFIIAISLSKFVFSEKIEVNSVSELGYSIQNINESFSNQIDEISTTQDVLKFPGNLFSYNFSIRNDLKAQVAVFDGDKKVLNGEIVPSAKLVNEKFYDSVLMCEYYDQKIVVDYSRVVKFYGYNYKEFESFLNKMNCKASFEENGSDNPILVYNGGYLLEIEPSNKTKSFLFIFSLIFIVAIIRFLKELYLIISKGKNYFSD